MDEHIATDHWHSNYQDSNVLEFCLELISKTMLAMVMKFCGWIGLFKEECSAHELQLLLA